MRKTAWGIAALLASSGAIAASPGPARITAAPAFRTQQLVALPREGWLTNGGNLGNQRYSPLTQINRDSVAGLKAVWRASLRGSGMEQKHSAAIVFDTAMTGRKNMPAFREVLTPEELRDVAAFIAQDLVTRAPAQATSP